MPETATQLTKVLKVILKSKPAAVLLDVDLGATVSPKVRNDLQKVIEDGGDGQDGPKGVRIAVLEHATPVHPDNASLQRNFSVQDSWFDDNRKRPKHVFPAISAVGVAPDGVVRTMLGDICALSINEGWVRIPTLPYVFSKDRKTMDTDCPDKGVRTQNEGEHYIVYKASSDILRRSSTDNPISFMKSGTITQPSSLSGCPPCGLEGRFVLIGQVSPADMHMTPLGQMPGVLVQANALATALQYPRGVVRSELLLTGETITILTSAALSALVPNLARFIATVLRGITMVPIRLAGVMIKRQTLTIKNSLTIWVIQLISLLSQLLAVCAIGFALIVLWVELFSSFALNALAYGVVVGTFLPVFVTTLDTIVETGRIAGRFLSESSNLIRAFLAGRIGPVVGVILATLSLVAGAQASSVASCLGNQQPMLDILKGDLADVYIFEDTQRAKHPKQRTDYPLHEFDTIQIKERAATIQVRQNGMNTPIKGPNVHYLVPPCSAEEELGLLHQFFAAVLSGPIQTTTRTASTILTRGGLKHLGHDADTAIQAEALIKIKHVIPGGDITVPLSGALRTLPVFAANDQMLIKARSGLAYAWMGGHPPYAVTISSGDASQILKVDQALVWLPDWQMPADDAAVIVRDSSGEILQTHLAAATKSNVSEPSVTNAIALFQTGDVGWRLEAFRELRTMAQTDMLAAQAVAAIRLSGTE